MRKLLGEQDFIGKSGLGHLFRNAYKRESKHQSKGVDQPTLKTEHLSISLIILQVK